VLPFNPNDARSALDTILQALPPALAYQIRLAAQQLPRVPGFGVSNRPLAFGSGPNPKADQWWNDPPPAPEGGIQAMALGAGAPPLPGEAPPPPAGQTAAALQGGGGAAGPASVRPADASGTGPVQGPGLDQQTQDALAIGPTQGPNLPAGANGPRGGGLPPASLGGSPDYTLDQGFAMLDNPGLALYSAMQQMGVDPNRNPFAARAIARNAEAAALIADILGQNTGQEVGTLAPGLIRQLITGELNGQEAIQQAINLAAGGDEGMTEVLRDRQRDVIEGLASTSRQAPGVTAARKRLRLRKLQDQQAEMLRNPAGADSNAWLALLRG
jgi:hypothetical protein